jgi:hypothetical protein
MVGKKTQVKAGIVVISNLELWIHAKTTGDVTKSCTSPKFLHIRVQEVAAPEAQEL